VRVAKADLVPTEANLLDAYASFAELQTACARFTEASTRGRSHSPSAGGDAHRAGAPIAPPEILKV
jgi:hypothetical protein